MHNTPEQNEAFKAAFDETNARWKAQIKHEEKQKSEQKNENCLKNQGKPLL